jgi:hypothetical protein
VSGSGEGRSSICPAETSQRAQLHLTSERTSWGSVTDEEVPSAANEVILYLLPVKVLGRSCDPKAIKRAEETEPLGRRIGRTDLFKVAGARRSVTRMAAAHDARRPAAGANPRPAILGRWRQALTSP